jgi:hypothetical protein
MHYIALTHRPPFAQPSRSRIALTHRSRNPPDRASRSPTAHRPRAHRARTSTTDRASRSHNPPDRASRSPTAHRPRAHRARTSTTDRTSPAARTTHPIAHRDRPSTTTHHPLRNPTPVTLLSMERSGTVSSYGTREYYFCTFAIRLYVFQKVTFTSFSDSIMIRSFHENSMYIHFYSRNFHDTSVILVRV